MVQMAEVVVEHHYLVPDNVTTINDSAPRNLLDNIVFSATDIAALKTIATIEKVALPVICIFGLLGNTLSTITFLRRPLRKAPCSLYLAVRGISDNGFLGSLLMVWISSTFDLRLSQVRGVCQTIVFGTYVCGCVSVWLCVFITFENFLLIQKPFTCRGGAGNNVSRLYVCLLVFVSVGFYHISLWTVNKDCTHDPDYLTLTQILVYTDTLLTLIIPTIVIFIMMTVIAYRVLRILHIRKLHSSLIEKLTNGKRPSKQIIPIAKVTKMLFVVSLTFFALNVPSHAIRLRNLIDTLTNHVSITPVVQSILQSIFFLMYYLSFSVNIIVYATFGSNFRRTFRKTFIRRRKSKASRYMPREALNLVNHRRGSIHLHLDYLDTMDTRQILLTTDYQRPSQLSV